MFVKKAKTSCKAQYLAAGMR